MNDQHDIWKEDAEQLKKDLASRPKQIIRREVEIKFGDVQQNQNTPNNLPKQNFIPKPAGSKRTEDFLKRQLGLE